MVRSGLLVSGFLVALAAIGGCGGVVDVPAEGGGDEAGATSGSAGVGSSGTGGARPCSVTPWSHGFDDAHEHEYGTGVAVSDACDVVVTGNFGGTIDFGGGPLTGDEDDLFLAKFDDLGEHLWSKRIGAAPQQAAGHVAIDRQGDIVVAGPFGGTLDFGCGPLTSSSMSLFVARLDPDGACLWSKQLGDGSETDAEAVAIDAAGNIVVAGNFTGSFDVGDGPLPAAEGGDIFVAELDPSGAAIWSRAFGGPGWDRLTAVAVDPTGGVILTGHFVQDIDFGGGALTGTGQYYDGFVAKLDASGEHVWSRAIPSSDQCDGMGVAATSSGQVIVAGAFTGAVDLGGGMQPSAGSFDGFLLALEPSGQPSWSRIFGGLGSESIYAVAVDGSDSAVITGAFSGDVDFGGGALTSAGIEDGFVVAYDRAGEHRYSKGFGGTVDQADVGMSVAVDGSGNALVTGVYAGTADFGSGDVTSAAGGFDVFLAKIPVR